MEEHSFMMKRRLAQSRRVVQYQARVNAWVEGVWETTKDPCGCGKSHTAIRVTSSRGEEILCPVTWVAWINFLQPKAGISLPFVLSGGRTMLFENIPKGLPAEEIDQWYEHYKKIGETALAELEKLRPDIAQKLREMEEEERKINLSLLRGSDDDII